MVLQKRYLSFGRDVVYEVIQKMDKEKYIAKRMWAFLIDRIYMAYLAEPLYDLFIRGKMKKKHAIILACIFVLILLVLGIKLYFVDQEIDRGVEAWKSRMTATIKPGMHKDDIVKKLGKPYDTYTIPETNKELGHLTKIPRGTTETWVYYHEAAICNIHFVDIFFDDKGRVIDYSFTST